MAVFKPGRSCIVVLLLLAGAQRASADAEVGRVVTPTPTPTRTPTAGEPAPITSTTPPGGSPAPATAPCGCPIDHGARRSAAAEAPAGVHGTNAPATETRAASGPDAAAGAGTSAAIDAASAPAGTTLDPRPAAGAKSGATEASLAAASEAATGAAPDAALDPTAPKPTPAEPPSLLQRLEPKGRFMVGVESDEGDDYDRRYGVTQARLGLAYREGPIRAEVEADLAETQVLNDAWLEVRPADWGRGRVGRFKAPFSGFLLSSTWERPVLRRQGMPRAVRDLGFGGREIGARLTFEAKDLARLEFDAGLFEGAALGVESASEDGYARVTVAPWKPLRLGASAGRRALFDGGGAGDAFGLDARLLLGGVTARLEGLRAENNLTGATIAGVIGHVAYRFPIGGRSWLEPGVEAELARHDDLDARSTWAATLGAGWGDRFLVRGGLEHGPESPADAASTALLLQAGVQL